ncbi:hypothetical protein AB0D34_45830, partial [Streptomyces sp. NPDC048420]|uniref:hypothetical protein n=1 Tax=Streptomyces sp. NPDC048420 TaxID=3155755 RepID=UPI00341D6833
MADAQGSDLTSAWREAITCAERALRGDRATREQVVAAVEVLRLDRRLPGRATVGQNVSDLVLLLDCLGLNHASQVLLEHVSSCFQQDPGALNLDTGVRNQLAVVLGERGYLATAAMLLTKPHGGDPWAAATLVNQACMMLRRGLSERAADTADQARRAVVLGAGEEETEQQLDVQVLATAVLAEVMRLRNQHAEADELVNELEGFVRRLVRILGGDHPKSLSALITLASAEFESARAAEDHERMERACDVIAIAVQRLSATLGTDHPRSLSALRTLATVEYETALFLGGGRRLQGAQALMTAAAERATALWRRDPQSSRQDSVDGYLHTCTPEDLDESIAAARAAVLAARPVSLSDRAAHLTRLRNALKERFARTGSIEDLDEIVNTVRATGATTPYDHRGRVADLGLLGDALWARFERTGAVDDHPDYATHLLRLVHALERQYTHTRTTEDLDELVETARAALAATPDDHRARTAALLLRDVLWMRFERTEAAEALDELVETVRAALAATPDDHRARTLGRWLLGNALRMRFERTEAAEDLD